MASHTGLEFTRWILAPGKWVHAQTTSFWNRYLYFVGVQQENDLLRQELDAAKVELSGLRENAAEVERLRRLLSITPPEEWTRQGARVISQRLGPNAALETMLIDKGSASGVTVNTPVLVPDGVVGRVLRLSPSSATVLLVTDPNSHIPVVSQTNRTQGILKGEGPSNELTMQYVPQGVALEEGEILVTSGLADIFPKGLPVAKVTKLGRSGSSLFQVVQAVPLFRPRQLEEVSLLFRNPGAASAAQPSGIAPAGAAVGDVDVLTAPTTVSGKAIKIHKKAVQPTAPDQPAASAQPSAPAVATPPAAPATPTVKKDASATSHQAPPEGTDRKKQRSSRHSAPQ